MSKTSGTSSLWTLRTQHVFFPLFIFTGRNEVVAKVIFLHLSVILFTGGVCLSACWDTTPQHQTTPQSRHPLEQTHTPWTRHHPPGTRPPWSRPSWHQTPRSRHPPDQTPLGSRLQHTVYERPVHILLECILVCPLLFFCVLSFLSISLYFLFRYLAKNNVID